MPLVDRKHVHLELFEDSPNSRLADMDIMVAFQINHDLPGPKMITLSQVDDLSENFRLSCPGAANRPARAV
jgi:hypothetical protein